jgi:hypothetical protein
LDHAELKRLCRFEWRQYPWKARRQHRFARARRADHQEIVPPCGRDLERALGAFLPLDISKIEPRRARRHEAGLRRWQKLSPLEMVDDGQQARRGNDLDLARPGRLAATSLGANYPIASCRGERCQQHSGHARQ